MKCYLANQNFKLKRFKRILVIEMEIPRENSNEIYRSTKKYHAQHMAFSLTRVQFYNRQLKYPQIAVKINHYPNKNMQEKVNKKSDSIRTMPTSVLEE